MPPQPQFAPEQCLDPGLYGPPTPECTPGYDPATGYSYDPSGTGVCEDPSVMSHWADDETCTPVEKKKSDVVYLGINDPAREAEIAALPEGATVVDGSKKQGTIMSADGKKELDLSNKDDVQRFLQESGAGALRRKEDGSFESEDERNKRMQDLQSVFLGRSENGKLVEPGMHKNSKDEMAEFIQTMQKVENGEIDMKRLIISGHHYPHEQGIHGTDGDGTGIRYAQLAAVMKHFGKAQNGVEDLMFSACNTVNGVKAQNDTYKALFPGLESVWGYSGIAPGPGEDKKNSSPAHIKAWEEASRGDDPQAVSDEAKTRFRAKTTTY